MSGGGMGGSGSRGYGSGVGVSQTVGRSGIRSAAGPTGPRGKPDRKGEGLGQAKTAAVAAPSAPPVPGASGGSVGTDTESAIAALAKSMRRRPARGGGLSNVTLGQVTLG